MDTLYLVFKDRFQIVLFGLPYRRPKLASSKRGLYPMDSTVSSALGLFIWLSFVPFSVPTKATKTPPACSPETFARVALNLPEHRVKSISKLHPEPVRHLSSRTQLNPVSRGRYNLVPNCPFAVAFLFVSSRRHVINSGRLRGVKTGRARSIPLELIWPNAAPMCAGLAVLASPET